MLGMELGHSVPALLMGLSCRDAVNAITVAVVLFVQQVTNGSDQPPNNAPLPVPPSLTKGLFYTESTVSLPQSCLHVGSKFTAEAQLPSLFRAEAQPVSCHMQGPGSTLYVPAGWIHVRAAARQPHTPHLLYGSALWMSKSGGLHRLEGDCREGVEPALEQWVVSEMLLQ